jgi:hypothetical protein
MPCLVCRNAPKRDTDGHILTEWPFCHVKLAIEHKRRYAHLQNRVFLVLKKCRVTTMSDRQSDRFLVACALKLFAACKGRIN